jgi:hypothetical protein
MVHMNISWRGRGPDYSDNDVNAGVEAVGPANPSGKTN